MPDKKTIVDLEKTFWDTMISKDAETAAAMMTDKSIVVGPQGVMQISHGDFKKMMDGSKWTLESYTMDNVEVLFPTEDTAVIGYKVKQKGMMDGKPYDMECADSSTWTRSGKSWLCALHTETMLPDAKKDKKAA